MKTITYDWLRRNGACEDSRDLAALHFGRSAPLNRTTLLEAAELGLEIDWLAAKLLPESSLTEYERQCAPFLEEYIRQCAPFLAEYERQCNLLLAEYERQRAPVLAEYERQCAPFWAEYERQRAMILADCLGLD